MPTKRDLTAQLRQAIKDSPDTLYAIAKGSEVSESILYRFANGERGISLETAARLCEHLGLRLTDRP